MVGLYDHVKITGTEITGVVVDKFINSDDVTLYTVEDDRQTKDDDGNINYELHNVLLDRLIKI